MHPYHFRLDLKHKKSCLELLLNYETTNNQLRVWGRGLTKYDSSDIEFNEILKLFVSEVVEPAKNGHNVDISFTDDQEDLADWFSPEVANLLRGYSQAIGGSERWNFKREFLVKAYLESGGKHRDEIYWWLIKDGGMSEKDASDFVEEFDLTFSTLETFFRLFPDHRPSMSRETPD